MLPTLPAETRMRYRFRYDQRFREDQSGQSETRVSSLRIVRRYEHSV
jgi:hypothetical protein